MTSSEAMLIEQNNATVAFLQSKDFPRAIESSILALQYNQIFERETTDHVSRRLTGSLLDQCMLLSTAASDEDEYDTGRDDAFIYDYAITIPPTIEEMNSEALIPVLIFNAALAHHGMAEHDSCHRPNMLQRAKQLYELAYHSCDLEENQLFQFAVINNIAVIDRDMSNLSAANECFEYLLSLLFMDGGYVIRLRLVKGFVANIPLRIKNAPAA